LTTSLIFAAAGARGAELDALLPDDVPGYGMPFGVTGNARHAVPEDATGWNIGDLRISPGLDLSSGYDTAPNGAAGGSVVARAAPQVLMIDPILGFGLYAGATEDAYPQTPRQTDTSATLAVGERAALPEQTLTVSAALLAAEETGFSLTPAVLAKPAAYTVQDLRLSDQLALGLFTVQPAISATKFRFGQFSSQDRTDYREDLTSGFSADGPGQAVLLLHANQSRYTATSFDSDTYAALAGIADNAPALWTIRLLAGAAHRQAAAGRDITAPVLEAAVDWLPTVFDRVRLNLAREIDDPDEVSAAPYVLTSATLSLSDDNLRNFTLNVSSTVENAAFLYTPLRETLLTFDTSLHWQLNETLSVYADDSFSDRQANDLRAANENIFTLGFSWSL
jgi:hypothetical protein